MERRNLVEARGRSFIGGVSSYLVQEELDEHAISHGAFIVSDFE